MFKRPHVANEMETLRMAIVSKGQSTKDKRKVHEVITKKMRQHASIVLYEQITRDMRAQYKYYDALGMWLGQANCWDDQDRDLLKRAGKDYLEDVR